MVELKVLYFCVSSFPENLRKKRQYDFYETPRMQPPTAYTAYTPTDAHVGTQLYTKYGTRYGVNVVM